MAETAASLFILAQAEAQKKGKCSISILKEFNITLFLFKLAHKFKNKLNSPTSKGWDWLLIKIYKPSSAVI